MADDLGFETLSIYGGTSYETPEIESLASEGMVFAKCYSTPLCTPSRIQLMTGKYNHSNYVGFGILDSTEMTFGDYFRQAGYRTAVAGKWQLWGNATQFKLAGTHGSTPEQAGFDEYCLWQVKKRGYRYKNPSISINSEDTTYFPGQYGPDIELQFIEEFIDRNADNPFFIYYPMTLTHDPFQPTPFNPGFEDFDPDSAFVNDTTYFGEMLYYTDSILGRIKSKIIEQGLENKTLVLFIGDNGTDRKVISQLEGTKVRGRKGYPVEYGTHVPFIAWGPGNIRNGAVSNSLIDFTDFIPTLLSAANTPGPDLTGLDGYDFSKEFEGTDLSAREFIYCYYDPKWGNFEKSSWVYDGTHKLYSNGKMYNVQNDVAEENDLALNGDAILQEVRNRLKEELDNQLSR